MSFKVGGDVQQECAARAVVHGAVVDAVAVDGLADTEVVYVRRENDVFIFEGGIGAGKLGDDVGGFDFGGEDSDFRGEGRRHGEMRKRFTVFGESGNFREGVAGTGEELFGGSRIESDSQLQAVGFIKLRAGESHGGVIAVQGDAAPGNVHGGRVGDGDNADGPGTVQGFPTFGSGLIVGAEGSGNIGGRARDENDNLALEVEPGEFVEIV